MMKKNVRLRVTRALMVAAIGGSAFQLSGCDPSVRSTLLTGLSTTTQSLSTALISAFFLGLENGSGSGSGASGLTTTS